MLIAARLLDIEGTTTPIDFVYQTLFPYARQHIVSFMRESSEEDLRPALTLLEEERRKDSDAPPDHAAYLLWLMDRDRKSTALKIVQGLIWRQGYESGELVSSVFPDVPAAFRRWKCAGQRVAIFSSGSVLAQKLLFRHTEYGDLTPLIDAYFDTTTGPKREAESYRHIAHQLRTPPGAIQFISDVVEELEAAENAGLQAVLALRPGNRPVEGYHARSLINFDEI